MEGNLELTPVQEHRFWVEVLEDHAHFVRDHLAEEETEQLEWAERYIEMFWRLRGVLMKVNESEPIQSPLMKAIAREIHPVAYGYFRFEGQLQHLCLAKQVKIGLSPSYFNGTLNENQEYLRLLNDYMQGQAPKRLPLADLMNMWLEDQLGHSELLHTVMMPKDFILAERAWEFYQTIKAHMVDHIAIQSYMRFTPPGFQSQLDHAHITAESVIGLYSLTIDAIRRFQHKPTISRASLRLLEHYIPETCYFLRKLADYVHDIRSISNFPSTDSGALADIV
jgi:hypothetical protein